MNSQSTTFKRRIVSVLLILLCITTLTPAVPAAFVEENPYNKFRNRERGKGAMSQEDELKFAAAAHDEIAKTNRFVTDQAMVGYLNDLGKRIAAKSGRPDLPYQFYLIENDQINAFTPGGGRVYVYTGLVKSTTSEGQLASVLAHEIGHNVGYHVSDQIKRAQTLGILAGIAGAILGNGALGNVTQLATQLLAGGYLFKRSRDAEREADYLGLYDLKDTGYNTDEMNNMFRLLASLGKQPGALEKAFASHPPAAERLANTEREIKENLPGTNQRGIRSTTAYDTMKRRLTGTASNTADSGNTSSGSSADTVAVRRDAEQLLSKMRESGARVLQAVRGDVTGDGGNDLVVVYDRRGITKGVVEIGSRTYPLVISARDTSLPLRDIIRLRIRPGTEAERPRIVIVSTGRNRTRVRDYWSWDDRGLKYLGSEEKDED